MRTVGHRRWCARGADGGKAKRGAEGGTARIQVGKDELKNEELLPIEMATVDDRTQ